MLIIAIEIIEYLSFLTFCIAMSAVPCKTMFLFYHKGVAAAHFFSGTGISSAYKKRLYVHTPLCRHLMPRPHITLQSFVAALNSTNCTSS